ncbi:MAG: hypothetical protein PHD37_17145 [Gallionellaceae bacterium]|nr:hypothetical protein [Gallionellaceae bacterium]
MDDELLLLESVSFSDVVCPGEMLVGSEPFILTEAVKPACAAAPKHISPTAINVFATMPRCKRSFMGRADRQREYIAGKFSFFMFFQSISKRTIRSSNISALPSATDSFKKQLGKFLVHEAPPQAQSKGATFYKTGFFRPDLGTSHTSSNSFSALILLGFKDIMV